MTTWHVRPKRILRKIRVRECSGVFRGAAGEGNTYTRTIKAADDLAAQAKREYERFLAYKHALKQKAWRPAHEVPHAVRHGATKGAMVAAIVLQGREPDVRYFDAADYKTATGESLHGYYIPGSANVWIATNTPDPLATGAHEAAHYLRPKWTEEQVTKFARNLACLYRGSTDLHISTRSAMDERGLEAMKDSDVLIDDSLDAFQRVVKYGMPVDWHWRWMGNLLADNLTLGNDQ